MYNRCIRVKYGVEKLFGLCVSPEVYGSGRSDAHDVGHQSFEQSLWAFGFYYMPKKIQKNANWVSKEKKYEKYLIQRRISCLSLIQRLIHSSIIETEKKKQMQ